MRFPIPSLIPCKQCLVKYKSDPIVKPPLKQVARQRTFDPNNRCNISEDIEMSNIVPVIPNVDMPNLLPELLGGQNTVPHVEQRDLGVRGSTETEASDSHQSDRAEVRASVRAPGQPTEVLYEPDSHELHAQDFVTQDNDQEVFQSVAPSQDFLSDVCWGPTEESDVHLNPERETENAGAQDDSQVDAEGLTKPPETPESEVGVASPVELEEPQQQDALQCISEPPAIEHLELEQNTDTEQIPPWRTEAASQELNEAAESRATDDRNSLSINESVENWQSSEPGSTALTVFGTVDDRVTAIKEKYQTMNDQTVQEMSMRAHKGVQALQESEKDMMDHIIDHKKKTVQKAQEVIQNQNQIQKSAESQICDALDQIMKAIPEQEGPPTQQQTAEMTSQEPTLSETPSQSVAWQQQGQEEAQEQLALEQQQHQACCLLLFTLLVSPTQIPKAHIAAADTFSAAAPEEAANQEHETLTWQQQDQEEVQQQHQQEAAEAANQERKLAEQQREQDEALRAFEVQHRQWEQQDAAVKKVANLECEPLQEQEAPDLELQQRHQQVQAVGLYDQQPEATYKEHEGLAQQQLQTQQTFERFASASKLLDNASAKLCELRQEEQLHHGQLIGIHLSVFFRDIDVDGELSGLPQPPFPEHVNMEYSGELSGLPEPDLLEHMDTDIDGKLLHLPEELPHTPGSVAGCSHNGEPSGQPEVHTSHF
ncbi:hypothetical protein V8E53_013340 [Lactarius tabidus]